MTMYDPSQTYSAMGGYPGVTNPFALPFLATSAMNPAAAFNPLAVAYPGIATAGGLHPQQLQLAQILAARAAIPQLLAASPWTAGLHNPLTVLQNPLLAAGLANPLVHPLLNPLVNPILAHQQLGAQINPFNPHIGLGIPQLGPQFGQIGSPFGQVGPQFGQIVPQIGGVLAPQSWVGQPGLYGSQTLGQVHPLVAQLTGRGFHDAGIYPWSGF